MTQHTIERTRFREAMSRVSAHVHLVTTDGPSGRRGVTVTSVCSVSDEPATMLVCLNVSSALNVRFEENGVFAIAPLGARNEAVARAFAGEGGLDTEGRFATGVWDTLSTGAPILREAPVAFDCRLIETRVVATHRILLGEVVGLRMGDADGALLYRERRYFAL